MRNEKNHTGKLYFFAILTIAIAIRIYYALTTPLLETDGAIALLNGRVFDERGIIPFEGPFAAILNGSLYKIFGESILIGKLGDTFAGIGILILVYLFTNRAYGERAAILASFFVAFSPLNILFSIMAKPYMILSFFITLSAYLFFIGAGSGRNYLIVLAGACIPIAFGFRTFSIFTILGMMLLSVLLLILKGDDGREGKIKFYHPLIFIVSAFLFLLPIIFWRTGSLGLYFFRDFGMPQWLKSQDFVYMEKWENVENHLLDSPYLFFPVFILFPFIMMKDRSKRSASLLSFCYAFSFMFLLLINPGHHFPRILVPAIPFFCIMSASMIDHLMNNLKRGESYLLLSALVFSPVIYILGRMTGYLDTEVQSSAGVLKMLCFISISFVIVFIFSFVISNESKGKMLIPVSVLVPLILIVFSAEGIRQVDRRINLLSAGIMPYIGAIEHLPASSFAKGIIYENNPFGMLEGKDSKDLRDLPLKDSLSLLSGDYKPVFLRNDISYIVMPMYKYADGIFFTYRDMSIRGNEEEPKMHEELLSSKNLNRIYDNSSIICLYDPSIKRAGKPADFTGRAFPVRPYMGNRGGEFIETFFNGSFPKAGLDFSSVTLKNLRKSPEKLTYTVNFIDDAVEGESFYESDEEHNPWFSVYSHWSQGMPYMSSEIDYFSNNAAMVFPLYDSYSEGKLVRKLALDEGSYKVYARLSLSGVGTGKARMDFLFNGSTLSSFDLSSPSLSSGRMTNYCIGKINVQNIDESSLEVKASGSSDGAGSYILFDRLFFIREDSVSESVNHQEQNNTLSSLMNEPWQIVKNEINIPPLAEKTITLPKYEEHAPSRVEILVYSSTSKLSSLLYYYR